MEEEARRDLIGGLEPILASLAVSALVPIVQGGAEKIAESPIKDVYAAIKDQILNMPGGPQAVEDFERCPGSAALSCAIQAYMLAIFRWNSMTARELAEVLEKARPVQQQMKG